MNQEKRAPRRNATSEQKNHGRNKPPATAERDGGHAQSTALLGALNRGERGNEKGRASSDHISHKPSRNSADMQIQRMLDAGAVREQGVVDTIMHDEYGFIKRVDHPDQIYFRLQDLKESSTDQPVAPGTEVSFFVTMESIKGKLSSRAILLERLPSGTVQMELVIARSLEATVILQAKTGAQEEPGQLRLLSAIRRVDIEAKCNISLKEEDLISVVGLWGRCLSEGLTLKVGDKVSIDLHYYRPEKLFFARSVRLLAYCKLGRQYGVVRTVKEVGSFGFISPSSGRLPDLYFRSKEVMGGDGAFVKESVLLAHEDLAVSFDMAVDDQASGGGSKGLGSPSLRLRAIRVCLEDPRLLPSSRTPASADEIRGLYLIKKGCRGSVQKEPKRDVPGVVLLDLGESDTTEDSATTLLAMRYPPDIVAAFDIFMRSAEQTELVIDLLNATQRKMYHSLLDEKYFGWAHEVVDAAALASGITSSSDNSNKDDANNAISKLKSIRIWKLSDEEYKIWAEEKKAKCAKETKGKQQFPSTPDSSIYFLKGDCDDSFGPVTKDLEVSFDLFFDCASNNLVGKCVKLTDEVVPGQEDVQRGVLAVVGAAGRSGRFGFVRCIPSDEKLFWHSSSIIIESGDSLSMYTEGVEVSFLIRVRGGLRCATAMKRVVAASVPEALSKNTEELDGFCVGIVTDVDAVILVDSSECPLLSKRFWNALNIGGAISMQQQQQLSGWDGGEGAGRKGEATGEDKGKTPTISAAGVTGRTVKTFGPLLRCPLPIERSVNGADTTSLVEGDVVRCRVVVNWVKQRYPCAVRVLEKLEGLRLTKRKGTVSRLKVRYQAGFVHGPDAQIDPSGLSDLCEITSSATVDEDSETCFYCNMREVQLAGRRLVPGSEPASSDAFNAQIGDQVEFLAADSVDNFATRFQGLALSVVSGVNAFGGSEIQFKRPSPINAELKQAQLKTGFRGISMAQGPPDDGVAVGFKSGWRQAMALASPGDEGGEAGQGQQQSPIQGPSALADEKERERILALPWAHLLSHLTTSPEDMKRGN